jgi:dTDP-4-dehydrorhamnose 3,5-epimerase
MENKYKNKFNDDLIINDEIVKTDVAPIFGDDRGYFTAINFESDSKRAYIIKNHRAGIIRAFHGHNKEKKTFYVLRGAFKVIVIDMKSGEWKSFNITEKGNNVIKIPPQTYHGFVSLSDDSKLLIISNSTYEESINDDVRMPFDILGKEVWEIDHR